MRGSLVSAGISLGGVNRKYPIMEPAGRHLALQWQLADGNAYSDKPTGLLNSEVAPAAEVTVAVKDAGNT